jgi:hypothetical protein
MARDDAKGSVKELQIGAAQNDDTENHESAADLVFVFVRMIRGQSELCCNNS